MQALFNRTNSTDSRFFVGLGVLVLALFVFLCLAVLLYRTMAHRHLLRVRAQLQEEKILRPLADLASPSSPEAAANGKDFLAAVKDLEAAYRSRRWITWGLATRNLVAPGVAESTLGGATPVFRSTESVPESWQETRRVLQDGSPLAAKATAYLQGPLGENYDLANLRSREVIAFAYYLAPWLYATAILNLQDGNVSGAIDDVQSIGRLCSLMVKPGTPFSLAMAQGLWQQGTDGLIWEILQSDKLTDDDLVRLQSTVSAESFLDHLLRMEQVDLARTPYTFAEIHRSPGRYFSEKFYSVSEKLTQDARTALWPLLWADVDQAKSLSSRAEQIRALRDAIAQKNLSALASFSPALSRFSKDGWWQFPVSKKILGDYGMTSTTCQVEAIRQLTIATIALERYRLKHGGYPDTLDALVPDFLAAVPVDWFDGKPLKYRPLPDGQYLLYSVGRDGRDDGGDPRPDSWSGSYSDITDGRDYIWPRRAK